MSIGAPPAIGLAQAHLHRLRVRYGETDQMGVAHHGSYVGWFEVARIEWLRDLNLSYAAMEAEGVFLPVTHLSIRYKRSARFDEVLEVETRLVELGVCRVAIDNRLTRPADGEVLAEARIELAAVGAEGRVRRLPDPIHAILSSNLCP